MDAITEKLKAIKAALSDPDTWSLAPLSAMCAEAIELRQKELGVLPLKSMSKRKHNADEPIFLEPGELWP